MSDKETAKTMKKLLEEIRGLRQDTRGSNRRKDQRSGIDAAHKRESAKEGRGTSALASIIGAPMAAARVGANLTAVGAGAAGAIGGGLFNMIASTIGGIIGLPVVAVGALGTAIATTVAAIGTAIGGIGLAAGGFGALLIGGSMFLDKMENLNVDAIRDNIVNLLNIKDSFDGDAGNFFKEGGLFGLTLIGIGAGLAVFAVGSAIAAGVDYFSRTGWAARVAENVNTLLAIGDDDIRRRAGDIAATTATLWLLGRSLSAFAVGSAIAAGVDYFSQTGWAARVAENVNTLLGIAAGIPGEDILGKIGTVFGSSGTLVLIGAGLAAFGIGNTFAGISMLMGDTPQRVVDGVKKLMSISELSTTKATDVLATLGMLGVGLALFGGGSILSSMGVGLSVAGDHLMRGIGWLSDDQPTIIHARVSDLLSIGNPGNLGKAGMAAIVLGELAIGLTAFAAGGFVGTLASAAAALVSFVLGTDNPIDAALSLADKAGDIRRAAGGLVDLREALNGFADLDMARLNNMNLDSFTRSITRAVPTLETAISGGRFGTFGPTVEGLASSNINYRQAARNIALIRGALGLETNLEGISTSRRASDIAINERALEARVTQIIQAPTSVNTTNVSSQTSQFMGAPSSRNTREPGRRHFTY